MKTTPLQNRHLLRQQLLREQLLPKSFASPTPQPEDLIWSSPDGGVWHQDLDFDHWDQEH